MTIIVGICCKDGVVIGADSAASFAQGNQRTIEQTTKKIDIVGGHVLVAGTGMIGLGQRFTEVVQQLWDKKALRGSSVEVGKLISKAAISDLHPQAPHKAHSARWWHSPAIIKRSCASLIFARFNPN